MRNELIEARKKSGLTQSEVAEKIGVATITISRFEREECSISADSYIAYMKAVGMDYESRLQSMNDEIKRIDLRVAEHDRNIAAIDSRIDSIISNMLTIRK